MIALLLDHKARPHPRERRYHCHHPGGAPRTWRLLALFAERGFSIELAGVDGLHRRLRDERR